MKYQKFISIFKDQAYSLSYEKQFDFAISISKKLFFDYQKFHEVYQWGNPDLLIDAINLCEQSKYPPVDLIKLKEMMSKIDSITPDMDDFGDEISSYALNACESVYEILQFLEDRDPIHIYNIGVYFTDTVYFRIQENGSLALDQIDEHPLMIQSKNFLLDQTK